MEIEKFLNSWIAAVNQYDTKAYLDCFLKDAILDDPSVGEIFVGIKNIENYFERYFIGYKTQTRIVEIEVKNKNRAFMEVEFTGDFPQGRLRGTFDLHFDRGKISKLTADLILPGTITI